MPEDGFEALAVELGGEALRDFFATAIRGTGDIDLVPLFADLGITLRFRQPEGPRDTGGTPGTRSEPGVTFGAAFDDHAGRPAQHRNVRRRRRAAGDHGHQGGSLRVPAEQRDPARQGHGREDVQEIGAAQGSAVEIGGYFLPDAAMCERAPLANTMPSAISPTAVWISAARAGESARRSASVV